MIINERAGSGGDYLPYTFRQAGLGPPRRRVKVNDIHLLSSLGRMIAAKSVLPTAEG
jgi:hypothetical protein